MALSQQNTPNDPHIRKQTVPRKFCFISGCRNTTMKYPDIIFFEVPYDDEKRKRQWLTIAKREEHINNKLARWYCCEEHFDLEQDLENFAQVNLTGEFPVLKKDVVPHKFETIEEPSLPVPARKANIEEWDKFKRRLIRAVSRLLHKENKPEDEVWAFLRKETGCNCLLLWERMHSLTIKKLSRHLLADDRAASVPAVARMMLTDWLMCDLVLVHEDIDVIGRFEEPVLPARDHRALISLFSLAQRFNVEALEGESLALAWSSAAAHYNTEGRQCSPMLLQRRWYQLKEWTRTHFYQFWQIYRGNKAKFEQVQDSMPGHLQQAIARRYRHVITEPFEDWQKLISWEKVILPDHFESLATRALPAPNDQDPDLIILDPVIETIDVDSDDDSRSEDTTKDLNNAFSNLEETIEEEAENVAECVFEPSKVKSEPKDDIDIEETIIDKPTQILDSTTKILEEFDKAFKTFSDENNQISLRDEKPYDTDIERDQNERTDEIVDGGQDLKTEPIEKESEIVENCDETAQSGFDVKMPMITSVFGNVAESELSDLSTKTVTGVSKQVTEISEDEDELEDIIKICDNSVDDMIKVKFDEFIDTKKKIDNFTFQQNNGKTENVVMESKNEVNSRDVELISDEVCVTKKELSQVEVEQSEEVKNDCNAVSSLDDQFDESSDIVSFVDDGVAYSDDEGLDEKCTGKAKIQTEEETPKFDLKLLMQPVVYTTKLDHMQSLLNENINSVNVKLIIEDIITESKPVHERSLRLTQQDAKEIELKIKNVDSSEDELNNDDHIKRQPIEGNDEEAEEEEEEEEEEKIEITDEIKVKTTSHLLQKPRNREYAPIQICKNPDFNTRLKRLNMGFYNFDKNIQYLNRCKPITIDVHKTFESKLINGTLYLKPGEVDVNTSIAEEDRSDHRTNIIPFAGPVQSLMNVPKATAQELIDEREASRRYIDEAETEEGDVVQTNRLTGEMPRPCLLPTRPPGPASVTKTTPGITAAPFAKHSSSATSVNAQIPLKGYTKPKPKPNPFLPRQKNPVVSWLSSKTVPVKLDEFLLTPDTLTKMLLAMDSKNAEQRDQIHKEFIGNKNKNASKPSLSKKPAQKQLGRPPKNKDIPNTRPAHKEDPSVSQVNCNVTDNSELSQEKDHVSPPEVIDLIEKPAVEIPTEVIEVDKSTDDIHDDNSRDLIIDLDESGKKCTGPKRRGPRKSYCCWARRKMTSNRFIKHPCPIENCTCCCMEAYHNKISETKRKQLEKLEKTKSIAKIPKINIRQNLTQSKDESSSKPVAHIKIVPKTNFQATSSETSIFSDQDPQVAQIIKPVNYFPKANVQATTDISFLSDQNARFKLAKVVQPAITKKPSIVIDGTRKSLLCSKALQSPIYLGKNKILLTSMRFPDDIDGTKPCADPSLTKVMTDFELPPGVQIVTLPNGLVTFTIDSQANISPSQLSSLPEILSKVQEGMNKIQSSPLKQSPINCLENNTVNTSEIVISDDEESTVAKTSQESQALSGTEPVNESIVENPINQEAKTNTSVGESILSRKTLLSDLMQMSGISFEDTIPQETQSESAAQGIRVEGTLFSQSIPNNAQAIVHPDTASILPLVTTPVDVAAHGDFISANAAAPLVTVSTDNLPSNNMVLNGSSSVDVSLVNVAVEKHDISQSHSIDAELVGPEIADKLNDNTTENVLTNIELNLSEDATLADAAFEKHDNSQFNSVDKELIAPEVGAKFNENTVIANDSVKEGVQLYTNNPITVDGIHMDVIPNQHQVLPTADILISRPGDLPKEFSAVTSFAKLKYVCENSGSFFKMDLETGLVIPINVCLKKRSSMAANSAGPKRVSIKVVPKKIFVKPIRKLQPESAEKEILPETTANLANNESQNSSIVPRPIKLIRTFQPGILRKRALLGEKTEFETQENIEVIKQKRKQRLMARIVNSSRAQLRIVREPLPIEILDSDEDNDQVNQSSEDVEKTCANNLDDSSDDEPLAKVAKKLHIQKDATISEELTNKSPELTKDTTQIDSNETLEAMEVDKETSNNIDLPEPESTQTILDTEKCFIPGLVSSTVTNSELSDEESSSDENCILGV